MPRSILFVCLGNICRSPLAEGVLRAMLQERGFGDRVALDSAGTGGWHVGRPADPRSVAVAARHGVDISGLRARQLTQADFSRFEIVLGMDRANVAVLRSLAPRGSAARLALYLDFATGGAGDVPDPYHGDGAAFLAVYRMVRQASEAMIDRLDTRASEPTSGQTSSMT